MIVQPTSAFRSIPHLFLMVVVVLLLAGQTHVQGAPAAPTGVTVSLSHLSEDLTGVLVNWTDNSADETSFQIYLTSVSQSVPVSHVVTSPTNTTQAHLRLAADFFPADATLYCWVAAANDSGCSEYGSVGIITNYASSFVNEPPSVPVVTAPSSTCIQLEWNDRSDGEEYTEVWARDTGIEGSQHELLARVLWNITSHRLVDYLQPGRTYELALRTSRPESASHDPGGCYSPFSDPVTIAMPGVFRATPPSPPANLSVAVFSDPANGTTRCFGVYFDDNATDETGYEIQCKAFDAPDEAFTTIGTIEGAVGTSRGIGTTIGDLSEASARVFRVRALRGNGPFAVASNFSESSGAAPAAFDAPADLRASVSNRDGRVQLFWSDNATDETGYRIEFRYGDSGDFTNLGVIESPEYSRYQSDGGIGGFTPGSTVQFQIRAVQSNVAATDPSNLATVTIPMAFAAPTSLTATVLGEHAVGLAWQDHSSNTSGLVIQARLLPDGAWFDAGLPADSSLSDPATSSRTSTLTLQNARLHPGRSYEFRVLAANAPEAGDQIHSPASNVVTASLPFNKPTNFTAVANGESIVSFSWNDHSAVESKFYLLARETGAADYHVIATPAADATSAHVSMTPGLSYDFAVAAVHVGTVDDEVISELTDVVECSLPFHAPSDLFAEAATDRQINLRWTDNSSAETGYVIYCKRSTDTSFQVCGVTKASETAFSTGHLDAAGDIPLEPNTMYQFEVRAFAGISNDQAVNDPSSVDSMAVRTFATTGSAMTKDGVTAALAPPMLVNQAFSHTFTATQGQSAISDSQILGALPPGISYDPVTRTLSGTPTVCGPYTPILMVKWANGWTSTQTLHLRPHFRPGPPRVKTPIADHAMSLGEGPLSIPLEFAFSDPDAESAVDIHVTGPDGTPGTRRITIILNDSVTPLTVANFRAYLNNESDGYKGSVFHRLVHDFVLQGGAFRSSQHTASSVNGLVGITKLPPIQNEPGLPNIEGTVAMAKMSGDPHSATSDFFFNLADNSGNLDSQNEGFSVFGRVARPSVATLMEMAGLPLLGAGSLIDPVEVSAATTAGSTTVTLSSLAAISIGQGVAGEGIPPNTLVTAIHDAASITLSNAATVSGSAMLSFGTPATFPSMPVIPAVSAEGSDASQMVRVDAISADVPVLSDYRAASSDPGVVTTSVTGTTLLVSPVAPGTSTISLQVTDLDGNQLQKPLTFQATVNNTLANWASSEGIPPGLDGPEADPDKDGRQNLLEYAFMSPPGIADGSTEPAPSTVMDGIAPKATITFKMRKFAALTYIVEGSSNLSSWTPVWTSTAGFAVPAVSAAVNNADHTLVTVKDSVPYSDTTPRFLRLKVTSP